VERRSEVEGGEAESGTGLETERRREADEAERQRHRVGGREAKRQMRRRGKGEAPATRALIQSAIPPRGGGR
jgi:hypothetical protein